MRRVGLIGGSGLLGSRLHAHLINEDIHVELSGFKPLSGTGSVLRKLDSIIDVSGPNALECESDKSVKERFLCRTNDVVQMCEKYGIGYYRITSINGLAANRQALACKRDSPGIYSELHSDLESLLFTKERKRFCTTIRLGNGFGCPIAPEFRQRHWLNIIGAMMLSTVESKSYKIENPEKLKGFIPLSLFCRSFSKILLDSRRGGLREIRSGFLLSLEETLELVRHVATGKEDKGGMEQLLDLLMRQDEQVALDDWYDRETYKKSFIQELVMMRDYLVKR